MIMEIGTVAAQILFLKYLFRIFGIGSLQCIVEDNNDLEHLAPLRIPVFTPPILREIYLCTIWFCTAPYFVSSFFKHKTATLQK
jgi:hypothetical protein